MKEQLNRENIEALSAYRFLRAKETLKEIPYLKQQGYYNTAVNRLYMPVIMQQSLCLLNTR